jgi:hypothetical protein
MSPILNKIKIGAAIVAGLFIFLALVYKLSPDSSSAKRTPAVKEGNLKDTWERFDIPLGKSCDVITNNENTAVVVRPNGDELLAYTMDVTGVATFISTGEPVKGKINRRVTHILYRGEGTNVGTPYVILCY